MAPSIIEKIPKEILLIKQTVNKSTQHWTLGVLKYSYDLTDLTLEGNNYE